MRNVDHDIVSVDCADEGVREALSGKLLAFWNFYKGHAGAARMGLSVRDLLAWVSLPTPILLIPTLSAPFPALVDRISSKFAHLGALLEALQCPPQTPP